MEYLEISSIWFYDKHFSDHLHINQKMKGSNFVGQTIIIKLRMHYGDLHSPKLKL